MHPLIVADRGSSHYLPGKGRFFPLAGLLALIVGTLVAGPIGAGIGLVALLLLLQIAHSASPTLTRPR
jgi:hypothetical protein